jgi:hypothetical protein
MANRYWVGGTGTWDAATTTNWSTSSGGAGGASVPATTDVVIFDNLSNATTYTVTRTATTGVLGITMAGPLSGTLTFAGSSQIPITTSGLSVTSTGVSWTNTGVLIFSGTCSVNTNGVSLAAGMNITGAGITVTLGSALTITGQLQHTQGTLALNGFSLTCFNYINGATTASTAISFGTSTIFITGNNLNVISVSTATNFTYTGTSSFNLTYSGATGARGIGFGNTAGATESNAINILISAGTDSLATTAGSSFKNLDFTGFTGTLQNLARTVYGNLTLNTGMAITTGVNATTFAATSGTQVITSNGVSSNIPFIQNGVGGTIQLADALTKTGANGLYTLTNGIFNANNFNVSLYAFSSNNSNTRTITMGSGTWSLSGGSIASTSVTVWDLATTTNLTFNKNTANISFTGNGVSLTKTFNGGGLTYNNITLKNNAGTATGVTVAITGSNTFAAFTALPTISWTLTLQAGTTTTISSWVITNPSAGNTLTFNSSSAGSRATISLASGTVSVSNFSIKDSAATGGASWQAYTVNGNTDNGNNTGWLFSNVAVYNGNFFLLFS